MSIFTVFFVVIVLGNINEYVTQKKNSIEIINQESKRVEDERLKLYNLKSKLKDDIEFVKNNKINLDVYKPNIDRVVNSINTNDKFEAKLVEFKEAEAYINVGIGTVSITSNFQNFGIETFGQILMQEFQSIGYVFPIKIVNSKRAIIKFIVIENKDI
jgi:hypothetical protein